jgi:hypothetical protein
MPPATWISSDAIGIAWTDGRLWVEKEGKVTVYDIR